MRRREAGTECERAKESDSKRMETQTGTRVGKKNRERKRREQHDEVDCERMRKCEKKGDGTRA